MTGKHEQKTVPVKGPVREESRERSRGRGYETTREAYHERDARPQQAYATSRNRDTSYGYAEEMSYGHPRRRIRWAIPILVIAIVLLLGLVSVSAYASYIIRQDTIFPNVFVNGINVGGLTVDQAEDAMDIGGADRYAGTSVTVVFPKGITLEITAEDVGVCGDLSVPAGAAYAYGRSGSALDALLDYLSCRTSPVLMTWEAAFQIDEDALQSIISNAAEELRVELSETETEIGEDGITIVKGMNEAQEIDVASVCALVEQAFRQEDYGEVTCELVTTATVEQTDGYALLQSLYDTVYVGPVNAIYDVDTGGATQSVQGTAFDLEAAEILWDEAEAGSQIFIPFTSIDPDIDTATLTARMFADCLAEKSTSLSGSSSARITNVTLAAAALNDTVINPGETFDYNTCVGERTAAKGYQEAGAYENGQHVTSIGGGICQDSSTLYYCAMYANLDITVRSNHYFVVTYLPRGMDATVSWGGPDFRFVNDRDYPIKIKAWVSDGYLTVQIWGTDVDGSYVEITSDTWEDSDYYYAQTYRMVYAADGTLLDSSEEAYSRYHKYEATTETDTDTTTTTESEDTSFVVFGSTTVSG